MIAMIRNLLAAQLVIVPVALLTRALMHLRAARLAPAARIATLRLRNVARESTGMALIAALFGLVVSLAYIIFARRWPDQTTLVFAQIGVGLALPLRSPEPDRG
jgi:hypothetical protein